MYSREILEPICAPGLFNRFSHIFLMPDRFHTALWICVKMFRYSWILFSFLVIDGILKPIEHHTKSAKTRFFCRIKQNCKFRVQNETGPSLNSRYAETRKFAVLTVEKAKCKFGRKSGINNIPMTGKPTRYSDKPSRASTAKISPISTSIRLKMVPYT